MGRRTRLLLMALFATTGAAGLIHMSYRSDLRRAHDAVNRGSLVVNTAAGPIEYAEKGTGAPLLSIHGAGGGYDQGLENAIHLVGGKYRTIAPSRFGYLRTPIPPNASAAAQADAHAALLSALNVSRAIVVGVSAGARSAVELALRHPDRVAALILIVPGTYAPTSPVAVEASRGSRFVFWLVNNGADLVWWMTEKLAPSILIRFLGVPPELVAASPTMERDRVMEMIKSIEPLSLRFSGINIDSNPNLGPLPLERITIPTLIVSARDDLFNTLPAAKYAASKIPGSKLVIYETGGHLMVGHERDVRQVVHNFLNQARLTETAQLSTAPSVN